MYLLLIFLLIIYCREYFCYPQELIIVAPNERVLAIHGQHSQNYTNDHVHGFNFQYQKIPYLPQGFSSLFVNIWFYEIFGGGLKQLSRADFRGLKDLKKFSVVYCEIKELPDDVFSDATELEEVMFQYCPLESLPETIFYHQPNLKEITFWYTNILTISSGLFAVAQNLESVQLSSNKIETFTPGCAEIFANVEKFDVSFNACNSGFARNEPSQLETVRNCNRSCEHVIYNLKTFKEKLIKCRTKLKKAVNENFRLKGERETCLMQQV